MHIRVAKIMGELTGPVDRLEDAENLAEILELEIAADGSVISERVIKANEVTANG